MADDDLVDTPKIKKAGTLKTVVFVVVALIIVSAIAWSLYSFFKPDYIPTPNPTQNSNSRSPQSIKERNGPNSDTTPSNTGTGPGSDNSLLGPN